jgi:aspartate/methionine/tyrosine aminotransferase
VPTVVRETLAAASNAPGYPATAGTQVMREAAASWLARRHQVTVDPDAILPVVGTKELVASLPTQLGCGPDDVVVHPALAYPTYDIGARLAGARPVSAATVAELTRQPDRGSPDGGPAAGDCAAGT